MDKIPDLGGFNVWEWVGSMFGSVVSIVYMKPETKAEFFTRLFVSFAVGGTVGFYIVEFFGWPEGVRYAFAGGAITAFFSYSAIGAAKRVLDQAVKFPKK